MEPNWAAENLQIIRTLMERTALYRRALAPIMMVAGGIGLVAALIPFFFPMQASVSFVAFWMSIGVAAVLSALILVRRQSLKDAEPFWSPPTRRVTLAVFPSFLAGTVAGILFALPHLSCEKIWLLPPVWMISYGCGLHAAGFFMQRGIRLFGLVFALAGMVILLASLTLPSWQTAQAGHAVMGLAFGLAHLTFGVYLYFTEKRKNAA